MTNTTTDILRRIQSWPQEDQEELAEVARDIEARRSGVYRATPQELQAIFVIDPGVRYKLAKIFITGNKYFDQEALRKGGTLGLISMRERARLVGGQLSIESGMGTGTRIFLEAPLSGAPVASRTWS